MVTNLLPQVLPLISDRPSAQFNSGCWSSNTRGVYAVISFSCSHCGAAIKVKDSSVGFQGMCRKCSKAVLVPSPVVQDAESAISEWENSDWGVESVEPDPYAKMPNPSRTGKARGSKTRTSKRFGRLLMLAFLFASAAGLVVSLGVAFVLIDKWSSGFDDGDAFRDFDRSRVLGFSTNTRTAPPAVFIGVKPFGPRYRAAILAYSYRKHV